MPRRIFVVDDEQVIADTLCAILHYQGYDVRPFYEAESLLRICEDQEPDLVISDVSMPGMSGAELAIRLKQRFPRCEVLLFTGDVATGAILEAAREKGCEFEVLTKPVHPRELLARVEHAVPRGARVDSVSLNSNALAG